MIIRLSKDLDMLVKKLNFTSVCVFCFVQFKCADVKGKICTDCKKPKLCKCGCGRLVKTAGKFYSPGHNPNTQSVESHKKQGEKIKGENNPAKRRDVQEKISKGVKGNHPSKMYPEKWKEHGKMLSANYNVKVSKQESKIKLPEPWKSQYKIGRLTADFANPQTKQIIEIFGCWYHCCPKHFPDAKTERQKRVLENDLKRKQALMGLGWEILEIWECCLEEFLNDNLYKKITT